MPEINNNSALLVLSNTASDGIRSRNPTLKDWRAREIKIGEASFEEHIEVPADAKPLICLQGAFDPFNMNAVIDTLLILKHLAGFINYTASLKTQVSEIESLMQVKDNNVREAAGMLGFLDLGLGLTNIGVVLQLSKDILSLVLKIQAASSEAAAKSWNSRSPFSNLSPCSESWSSVTKTFDCLYSE